MRQVFHDYHPPLILVWEIDWFLVIIYFIFRQKTKILWLKHFPEEPFDLDESKENSPKEFPNGLVSKIGYNIEEAALRQRDFYYQVRIYNISQSKR